MTLRRRRKLSGDQTHPLASLPRTRVKRVGNDPAGAPRTSGDKTRPLVSPSRIRVSARWTYDRPIPGLCVGVLVSGAFTSLQENHHGLQTFYGFKMISQNVVERVPTFCGRQNWSWGSEGFTNFETENVVAKKPELGLRGKFLNEFEYRFETCLSVA